MKALFKILFFLMLLYPYVTAIAHKVGIFAYAEKGQINVETYFYSGKKCQKCQIEVFEGSENKLLLKGKTDRNGNYSFAIEEIDIDRVDSLKFILNAGVGHRGEYLLDHEEYMEAVNGVTVNKKYEHKVRKREDGNVLLKAFFGVMIIIIFAVILRYLMKGRKEISKNAS